MTRVIELKEMNPKLSVAENESGAKCTGFRVMYKSGCIFYGSLYASRLRIKQRDFYL